MSAILKARGTPRTINAGTVLFERASVTWLRSVRTLASVVNLVGTALTCTAIADCFSPCPRRLSRKQGPQVSHLDVDVAIHQHGLAAAARRNGRVRIVAETDFRRPIGMRGQANLDLVRLVGRIWGKLIAGLAKARNGGHCLSRPDDVDDLCR